MPRKPTAIAREARERIIETVAGMPEGAILPTTRELGETHDLHPSTIFRLLRDLAAEGYVWQSPNGRFYPAGAQSYTLRGAPLCFIGRELLQWSRLYQEILEGVSEVCSANGSPLVLLSSPTLVQQETPAGPIQRASLKQQGVEMSRLTSAIPKGCAGYVFDHLWKGAVIQAAQTGGGTSLQLLHPKSPLESVQPDYLAGAGMVAEHLRTETAARVYLIRPFEGDPAVDAMLGALRQTLAPFAPRETSLSEAARAFSGQAGKSRLFFVSPEDNTALALGELIRGSRSAAAQTAQVIATQGTGLVIAPTLRLRYDYRRLGRSAAARILHGTEFIPLPPMWIQPGVE